MPGHQRGAAGGHRRPVLGAALLDRAAGPDADRRPAADRGRPGQARRRRVRGAGDRPRRGRRRDQRRPDGPARRARHARPLPATASAPHLSGGAPVSEFLSLDRGERVLALCSLGTDGPGSRSAPAQGVVKRVTPDYPSNKDSWEVVGLKDGDRVVGAVELADEDRRAGLRHHRRPAAALPGVERAPAGPVGRRHGRRPARRRRAGGVLRRRCRPAPMPPVVTVVRVVGGAARHRRRVGQGHAVRRVPAPRAAGTGGVRCHRFLRGEDTLIARLGGRGTGRGRLRRPACRSTCPRRDRRRDGSGVRRQPAGRRRRRPGARPLRHARNRSGGVALGAGRRRGPRSLRRRTT